MCIRDRQRGGNRYNLAMYERRGYSEVSRRTDTARVELVVMGKDRD